MMMNESNKAAERGISRRRFLQKSAVLAAAAAPALSIARSAHAAGSDVIRIGMVGCGGRCAGAASDAMTADPAVRLVAMTDLFADRVESRRKALKGQKPDQVAVDDDHCFSGVDGYKKVIPLVDVVLIACAAKFHPMYAKAGIEAGKHVFVEKPHAIDPLGIKVLREAGALAKEKKLGILSGLQSRFHPAIRGTVERVLDGQIGRVVAIEENFIRGPYGATKRPEGMRELEAQYGNQYRFSWLCGDDVPQSLVHNLDRATWALKETPPVKCHGMGGRSGPQNLLGDVFDHNAVVYHYADGTRLYALCRTTNNCYNECSSIILGSREFIKSIRAGQPLNCVDYMAMSTMVGIMGQLSCYSGKEVTWDEVNKSEYYFAPKPEDCTWDMEPPTKPDANGVYPVCASPGSTKNL